MKLSFYQFLLVLSIILPAKLQAQFNPKNEYTHADTLRGSLLPLPSCYDINFYHLDVKFNIDQKYISGSNEFRFTAVEAFNKLQFDLFENLRIDKILFHGKAVSFIREGNAVFVTFPDTIKKGGKDTFIVYYSGNPIVTEKAPRFGGVVFSKDSLGNPFVATACEASGASIWWPNKDNLSDEVDSMLISISVPNGLKDVSNGRLRKVVNLRNGYTRFDWVVSTPINNYNVAVNIGKYVHFDDKYNGQNGELTIDYWMLPYNLKKAKLQFESNVKPMLMAYEHWFGPYPFYKDGYKLVETPYPAMEHQSAISYGGYMKNGPPNVLIGETGGIKWDFIILHESAHEWFGNSITAKDLADLWIHEAFGSYAESLFVEYRYGKQKGLEYLHQQRSGISNDAPIVAPYGVNQMGSGDMYSKGATLLNMIRTIVNDDQKWRGILNGINKNFYHQTVTYEQVVNYFSIQSGKNLVPIFDQYLKFRELPVLEFSNKDGRLSCRWIANANGFNMPVKVKVNDGEYQWISPSDKFTTVNIPGASIDNIKVDRLNCYIGVALN
jgi:aminopeptidase N